MREIAEIIVTAWEIFNVAPTIVVGQMKLIVALTHLMMEVNFWYSQKLPMSFLRSIYDYYKF